MTETVLITGASSGIGLELTELFARDACDLVLVARNGEKLQQVAKEIQKRYHVNVTVIAKDLSCQTSPTELVDELDASAIEITTLVNNAGFGGHGRFYETDLESDVNMMQVNMLSLTALTKLIIKKMVSRGSGRILNVASTAAFQPGPLMAVYYATKAYVFSFSEALANELSDVGITVTVLCPGPTRTNFQDRAGTSNTRLFQSNVMDAKTVASIGYNACKKGKSISSSGKVLQVIWK